MLYLDTSLELEGLILFRDYNSHDRYYYMPRAPHLTTEAGQPMFQLLIYRRDITDNPDFHEGDRPGGGFLTMTVDLGVPQSTLEAVKGQLRGHAGGNIELVPVPFEDGSVRISALGRLRRSSGRGGGRCRRGRGRRGGARAPLRREHPGRGAPQPVRGQPDGVHHRAFA